MLAKCGIQVPMTDLFGVAGNQLLDRLTLPAPYAARIASLRRLIDALDFEIDLFTGLAQRRLAHDPGYVAVQQIPGIGPILGAVFVAEIGDVHRFAGPAQLTCWAGLTPKHHESDTTCTAAGSPSRAPGWSAGPRSSRCRSCPHTARRRDPGPGRAPPRHATSASSPPPADSSSCVFYALRDHHVRALHHPPARGMSSPRTPAGRGSCRS